MPGQPRELVSDVVGYARTPSACPVALIQEVLAVMPKKQGLHLPDVYVNNGNNGLIAVGGQGIVIKCMNANEVYVALKIARPVFQSNVVQNSNLVNDFVPLKGIPDHRFIESAKCQLKLEEKAAGRGYSFVIPRVYPDSIGDKPFPYMVMKWIEGVEIVELLRDKNDLIYSLNMFLKVLDGAMFLHREGYVHRDFKISNFRATHNDDLVMLDFGLVKEMAVDRNMTLCGTSLGTPPYASLNQLRNAENADHIDDTHSLGYVLWEFVNKKQVPPFTGSAFDEKNRMTYRMMCCSHLPEKIKPIFLRATTDDVSRAYPVVADMKEDIVDLIEKLGYNSKRADYEDTEVTAPRAPQTPVGAEIIKGGFIRNSFQPVKFDLSAQTPRDTLEEGKNKYDSLIERINKVDCTRTCQFPQCNGKGICKTILKAELELLKEFLL